MQSETRKHCVSLVMRESSVPIFNRLKFSQRLVPDQIIKMSLQIQINLHELFKKQ